MGLFSPRYKRYAAWPVVIWCRLRRHVGQGEFYTPVRARCICCGDYTDAVRAWTIDRDGRVRTEKDRPVVLKASGKK